MANGMGRGAVWLAALGLLAGCGDGGSSGGPAAEDAAEEARAGIEPDAEADADEAPPVDEADEAEETTPVEEAEADGEGPEPEAEAEPREGEGPECEVVAGEPARGLLQFHVQHTIADDSCLRRGDCDLRSEDRVEEIADFLGVLADNSNMPVLHYDYAIPWLAFDEDPPPGADRLDYYEPRLHPDLRRYLDAFADRFACRPGGFLAISPLGGSRDRLQDFRVTMHEQVPTTEACPALAPGTTITFPYEGGTASFDLYRAYRNWVLYLSAKLRPAHLGLMVEANMLQGVCPARWPELVDLYHQLYDEVRAEVGAGVQLFATVVLAPLLAFDFDACHADLTWGDCAAPTTTPATPDPAACYPLDRTALDDLAAGGRLDVLALSWYPDSMSMSVPGAPPTVIRAYPEDWDGTGACALQAELSPFVDPLAALDRLGWTGPIGWAEVSARSCTTWTWIADSPYPLVSVSGSPESQVFWMYLLLTGAAERGFEFVNWSLPVDYPPLGYWSVQQGVLDPWTFSVLNTWPCSGVLDVDLQDKPVVAERWRASWR